MMKYFVLVFSLFALTQKASSQLLKDKNTFDKEDTLRGYNNEYRSFWDVKHYGLQVTPTFESGTIAGEVSITYQVKQLVDSAMQIDLQAPMMIDSVKWMRKTISYKKSTTNTWHIFLPHKKFNARGNQTITIYFHGAPKKAVNPPWDGGWIWKKDDLGRPWMSVACQGLGASCWFPCKDIQSDKADLGCSMKLIVDDTLTAIGNGRLISTQQISNRKKQFYWQTVSAISTYNIVPYIGKYEVRKDTFISKKENLSLEYWMLDYVFESEKKLDSTLYQVKPMLRAFEYWFGYYPFYNDGYKLVQSPHLGMEHQSNIAYGNQFKNGYLGKDLSKTGWGLKWDFIIVHESGHEWFGNHVTAADIADNWIHEGFTCYAETLFTEYYYGMQAANEYNYGLRNKILNDKPIIGPYGVNKEGSNDMYFKGANMLHTLRHMLHNDELFIELLHTIQNEFSSQPVTSKQIEEAIEQVTKLPLKSFFNQYLRTTKIPVLHYFIDDDKQTLFYKFEQTVPGFEMRIPLPSEKTVLQVNEVWQQTPLSEEDLAWIKQQNIPKLFYCKIKPYTKKPI